MTARLQLVHSRPEPLEVEPRRRALPEREVGAGRLSPWALLAWLVVLSAGFAFWFKGLPLVFALIRRAAAAVGLTLLLLQMGCRSAAAAPARDDTAAGVLEQLDVLAARAAALEQQRELERGAVSALVEACGLLGIEALDVSPGRVSGRCARPSLGRHRVTHAATSSRTEGGRAAEDRVGRPSLSDVERPGPAGEDLAGAGRAPGSARP